VWGLRTFGSDAGRASVGEQPAIVAEMLADLLDGDARLEVDERAALVAEARAEIRDPVLRGKFDAALAYAERVYPIREDNVLLTEQIPVGPCGGRASRSGEGSWRGALSMVRRTRSCSRSKSFAKQ
jgi:hypothetical protein